MRIWWALTCAVILLCSADSPDSGEWPPPKGLIGSHVDWARLTDEELLIHSTPGVDWMNVALIIEPKIQAELRESRSLFFEDGLFVQLGGQVVSKEHFGLDFKVFTVLRGFASEELLDNGGTYLGDEIAQLSQMQYFPELNVVEVEKSGAHTVSIPSKYIPEDIKAKLKAGKALLYTGNTGAVMEYVKIAVE